MRWGLPGSRERSQRECSPVGDGGLPGPELLQERGTPCTSSKIGHPCLEANALWV